MGGDFYCRHRRAQGSAAPGGERNDVGAARGKVGAGDNVVPRAGEQIQPRGFTRLRVIKYRRDRRCAAFLDAAQRLFFKRGYPARFVAG
ncbi:hypothetical protein SDC9_160772 [bioreactor metagenome]|uniref:Uncharacterized protein n=1 Tax=bioreactor metagenome TaxID=1076179 RepID=A0A645FGG1_9ZZZZ